MSINLCICDKQIRKCPYQDALDLLNGDKGKRLDAVKSMISNMSYSDLKLITNFSLVIERESR